MGGGLRRDVGVWLTVKFGSGRVCVRVTGLRYLPCDAIRCIFVTPWLSTAFLTSRRSATWAKDAVSESAALAKSSLRATVLEISVMKLS